MEYSSNLNFYLSWLLEVVAYCAVDCFGLISGYLLWNSKMSIRRIIELWLQVLFYTIVLTGIMCSVFPEYRMLKSVVNAFFPITRTQYWYISAYFGVCLLIPFLNAIISKCEQRIMKYVFGSIFLIMCIIPTVLRSDPFGMAQGYSTFWLCILYLFGGYIGKYNVFFKTPKYKMVVIYVTSILVGYLYVILAKRIMGWEPIAYTSPFVIVTAISLFEICRKLHLKKNTKTILGIFSSSALGVYLIHNHPLVFDKFIINYATSWVKLPGYILVGKVLGSALLIWSICVLVDWGRGKLFKLLKISQFCLQIENYIIGIMEKETI